MTRRAATPAEAATTDDEPRQACQVEGCAGSWAQSDNWSGRFQCDNCLAKMGQEDMRTPPEPLAAGTFALYPSPDGGMVLVTDVQGRGVERRPIPAALIKAVTGGGMVGKLFGIGR